jgi:organic hydroperoxide reductase OsmC/OhrA
MSKDHIYKTMVKWVGNKGVGTTNYSAYSRDHVISVAGKPDIPGSSDPAFRGDKSRYNPEELLVSSLSTCHMLWYLHLCAEAGVVVVGYVDHATGTMSETEDGGGKFTKVDLHPTVTVLNESMMGTARNLHQKAHDMCFIANSVNFSVITHATIVVSCD